MSDDDAKPECGTTTPEPDSSAKTDPAPAPQPAPFQPLADPYRLTTWVKGGTPSSRYEKYVAELHADSEARRNESVAERRLASIPIEQGGAKLYSANFTDMHDPRVILIFDEPTYSHPLEILCELVQDDVTSENILIFTCPDCVYRGVPSDLAQRRVSDRHRKWHLDTKERGQPGAYIDAWGHKQIYIKAGKIVDTDVLRCTEYNCTFACRIDNNVMRRVR